MAHKLKLESFFIPRYKDYECPECFCHVGDFAFRRKDKSVICYECWDKNNKIINPISREEEQRLMDQLPF